VIAGTPVGYEGRGASHYKTLVGAPIDLARKRNRDTLDAVAEHRTLVLIAGSAIEDAAPIVIFASRGMLA